MWNWTNIFVTVGAIRCCIKVSNGTLWCLTITCTHTGGEGEHWQAARPSGGSVVPPRGDGKGCTASGGPEDPGDCHPPQHQLGQTEQALPGQTEVRTGFHHCRTFKTDLYADILYTDSNAHLCVFVCVHIKALAGLQLQVAQVCLRSESSGGVADWRWEHFETGWEWSSSTQTASQGNTHAHTHHRLKHFSTYTRMIVSQKAAECIPVVDDSYFIPSVH